MQGLRRRPDAKHIKTGNAAAKGQGHVNAGYRECLAGQARIVGERDQEASLVTHIELDGLLNIGNLAGFRGLPPKWLKVMRLTCQ